MAGIFYTSPVRFLKKKMKRAQLLLRNKKNFIPVEQQLLKGYEIKADTMFAALFKKAIKLV